MVERLLDEAQIAADAGDWATVDLRARAALRLDPDDPDAQMFASAAQNSQGPRTRADQWEIDKAEIKEDWHKNKAGLIPLIIIVVLWLGGFADVFLSENGLPPVGLHSCYSNAFGKTWCDGPFSTRSIPDGAVKTEDGYRLP